MALYLMKIHLISRVVGGLRQEIYKKVDTNGNEGDRDSQVLCSQIQALKNHVEF